MRALRDDLRLAFRAIAHRPGTAALVVLSVGIAIGANTAFFGVMRGLVLQPLPYPQADRLVVLFQLERGAADPERRATQADFVDWRRQARGVTDLAAFQVASFEVSSTEPAEKVSGARVTPGFLPLFGARMHLGRPLQAPRS